MRLKYVLRRLMHSPGFTTIAVLTLGIGIGANTAIFSVIEGVLLKPLSYSHPEQLVDVNHTAPGVNMPDVGSAPFLYFTYRDEGRSFQNMGLVNGDAVSITGSGEPEHVQTLDVTADVLPALSVQPLLGRSFSQKDDSPGASPTAILTYGYWQRKFGGDAAVLGRRLIVDGKAAEIIGVLPAGFRFMDMKLSMLQPLQLDRNKTFVGNFSYRSVARLKPGVTMAQASADIARMIPIALHKFPPYAGLNIEMFVKARLGPKLQPLKDTLIGDIGKVLWVLMGTIGMVLLIACANVANLLLVRADGRQQELAIRAALGANRSRLAAELLMESMTLGLFGGVLALGLAYGAVRLLLALAPSYIPRLDQISIDAPVLLFTLVVSLFAGLLFGMIPVLKYGSPRVAQALRSGGRTLSQSKDRHRTRNTLVIVEVALALVLLISSGLMIRTFEALRHVQPGFTQPEEVQSVRISIPDSQVPDDVKAIRMEQAIVDKVAEIPGVTSVAFTSNMPMTGNSWTDAIYAEDKVYSQSEIPPLRRFKFHSPGLLKAMGNALVAGRDFTWTDVYDKRPVAMVSENLARELWHDPRAAIGKRIRPVPGEPWREIVGVAGDERDDGVNQKAPKFAIWPILMDNFSTNKIFAARNFSLVIRSSRAGSSSLIAAVQQAIWSVNPNLPLADVHTLEDLAQKSMARTSFTLLMLAIAGGMALLLGVVGIYGVISYSVSQRTREIGIRMALGAKRSELTRLFVGNGLRLVAIGAVFGLAAAAVLMRFMQSLLFEVSPFDPVTYCAVTLTLVAAALMASYVPALRATMIDPMEALRAE
jgi:predicted permease